MFFADPTAAFTTSRNAQTQRPTGLCLLAESSAQPIFTAPMQAALSVLPPPPPAKPGAATVGLADKDLIQRVLTDAGFRDPRIEPLTLQLSVGESQSFDEIFEELIQIGPAAALIADDPALKPARTAVYERLSEFYLQEKAFRLKLIFGW